MVDSEPCRTCHCPTFVILSGEATICHGCSALRTRYNYDSCLYSGLYAANYQVYAQTPINLALQLCRLGIASQYMRADSKLLDFGCCIAEFISFAERYYNCTGFEPNEYALDVAKKRPLKSFIAGNTKDVEKQRYNVITMFDVLEHIEDPRSLLLWMYTLLHPGGVIVVTTPNLNAVSGSGSYETLPSWKHYKPKEHLWLHNVESLQKLFTIAGFKPLLYSFEESRIRPGNPRNDILTFVARKNA